jgi:hypothetical protein
MQASSYHHGDRVRPSETLSHLSGRTKPEREARNRVITRKSSHAVGPRGEHPQIHRRRRRKALMIHR